VKSKFSFSTIAPFGLVWLTACSSADPTLLPSEPQEPDDLTIESVELVQAESWPVQIRMELAGTLPSACYRLDYAVILPGTDGVIEVEAHAKLEENTVCEQHAEPFRQAIGLGSYMEGDLQILLIPAQISNSPTNSPLSQTLYEPSEYDPMARRSSIS